MDEKVEAESLFKGKKSLYGDSVKHMFVDSRLGNYVKPSCVKMCHDFSRQRVQSFTVYYVTVYIVYYIDLL